MFQTKTLARVLPTLHKPLPLNRREAQRLLDTLTTSFRKHLDKEHGWLPDEAPSASAAQPASAHRRPTDHHLSSILSNPLFNPPTISPASNNASSTHAKHGVATFTKETAVFDEAVARGMMTLSRAHGFLIAVRNSILRSSFLSVQDGMQASGAGMRVASWIQSSGMEKNLSFLNNEGFLRLLVPFMVAEGLEEKLWTWLEQIRDMSSSPTLKAPPRWFFLLGAIARAKTLDGGTLDAAYASILRGEELFKHHDYQNLIHAWLIVWWQSTVKAWRFSPASEDLFENYVAISDHLKRPLVLQRAHLDLHHPNPAKTTPERAVRLFMEDGPKGGWREALSVPHKSSGFKANQIMSLGLDTVKYLSEAGDSALAQRILEILQREIEPLFPASDKAFRITY
ncbi:hypothetical protein BR93DRAFT_61826 [Coniochaeta sp. PMI_546]|nr:hypothetical protein BR93DRAFT_61826 [Coniochaeta sp. PMI_546]